MKTSEIFAINKDIYKKTINFINPNINQWLVTTEYLYHQVSIHQR